MMSRRAREISSPPLDQKLIRYLAIAEDHRIGRHLGFDTVAIGRATWRRVAKGRREGASTIAQQLVRTITGRRERTLRRKLREIVLAIFLTANYTTEEISLAYLRLAYFGWRMQGVDEAGQRLGIDVSSTTKSQAATLIARLKYPQPREMPAKRAKQIFARTKHILSLEDCSLRSPSEHHLKSLKNETA